MNLEHTKQLAAYYNPTYLVSVIPIKQDISQDDNFLLWLMKSGYETSYSNKNNKDLQFRYNQTTHTKQLTKDIDDCFCFGGDADFFETDEQTRAKSQAKKQAIEDLENEFVCWKMDNWRLFIENNWNGDMELYYQFMKQREKRK